MLLTMLTIVPCFIGQQLVWGRDYSAVDVLRDNVLVIAFSWSVPNLSQARAGVRIECEWHLNYP